MLKYRLAIVVVLILFCGRAYAKGIKTRTASQYVAALKKVTDIMVNDVASPVAASRYYAYVTLAAYETQSLLDSMAYPSLGGRLHQFQKLDVDGRWLKTADPSLSVILAIFKSGNKLMPSGYLLQKDIDSVAALYQGNDMARETFANSSALVDEVVNQIVRYAASDGFRRLNNLPRYTPKAANAFWKPTAPAFMAPVEPHWNTLRPFLLDSAQQYKVKLPAAYDTMPSSSFYTQMMEVYNITKAAKPEEQAIAMFWDCNPFAVQQIGHIEFGIKKISPGGHWVGITGIACIKENLSMAKTAQVHALVSLTLADAFIACWDEKYRSNRVRPETVIQKLLDPRWHPLLQTPPFPEYVSGHSVASTACALVLTRIFGQSFPYTDDTEIEFGLPARKYKSFLQASAEAAISRLYGGIHYRDAIDEGIWQGTKVAEHALMKLEVYMARVGR